MNKEQLKALALADANLRLKSTNKAPSTGSGPESSGLGAALSQGIDSAGQASGRGVEALGEIFGSDGLKKYGKEWAETNEAEMKAANYKRPEGADGIIKNLMEGDLVNAGKSLGYGSLESGPSIATGLAATVAAGTAATVGSPLLAATAGVTALGATLAGSLQSLGEMKNEAKDQNLDTTATMQDLSAAIASGLVELVPLARGAGFTVKFLTEGAQEAIQEGLVVGNTAIKGGEYVASEVAERLGDAGITGGVVSSALSATGSATGAVAGAAKGAVEGVRTDNKDFTADEAKAAERIVRAADGDMDVLANTSTDGEGSAKGAANAALREARAELKNTAKNLKALFKYQGNQDGETALDTLLAQASHQGTPSPESHIAEFTKHAKGEVDADRIKSLVHEINAIQKFTVKGTEDMGGLSQYTRNFDLTDRRSSMKLGMYAAIAGGLSFGGVVPAVATIGTGYLANRTARGFDRMTNNRSKVKRFVDSVNKKGTTAAELEGLTSNDNLNSLKELARIAKQEASDLKNYNNKYDEALRRAPEEERKAADRAKKQEAAESEAKSTVSLGALNAKANSQMFETGVIPENDPYFKGYRLWQEATGLNPEDTLSAIEQLEREGEIPEGTAQRYSEDIYSFKKDKSVAPIQRIVRDRANPDYEPKFSDMSVEKAMRKLDAVSNRPVGKRGKSKAKEGERRAQNLVSEIEGNENSLNPEQYFGLLSLKEAIDRPDKTAEDRSAMVKEGLETLFGDDVIQNAFWSKKFAPLSTIGNDYAIERKVETEKEKTAEFEAKKTKAKTAKKRTKPSAVNQPELEPEAAKTIAPEALAKLEDTGKTDEVEIPSDSSQLVTASEVISPLDVSKAGNKRGIADMVDGRINQIETAVEVADKGADILQDVMDNLPPSTQGRVEGLIYEFATDQLTVNMLVDAFATRYQVPPTQAAVLVNNALSDWQKAGVLKIFKPFMNNRLKADGEYKKGEDGTPLEVMKVEFTEGTPFQGYVEIAKALRQVERMVNQDAPDVAFSPTELSEGPHKALKDYAPAQIDGSFSPILGFLNALRSMKTGIHSGVLTQIEDALVAGKTDGRSKTLSSVLRPVVKEETVVSKTGKKRKKVTRDDGPLRAVSQLIYQLGNQDNRHDNRIRQEWGAGANLRVYSKNGVAHTQSGDIMKGLMRTGEKSTINGPEDLKFIFHSFGNLLGHDKKSPLERRESIFEGDTIDNLITFAKDPFGRNTMESSKGNSTPVAQLVKDGEGFFQVLNAAHEVKNMVEWARARHKKKSKLSSKELLRDPDVRADMAKYYSTDFIVQLDASNNAYQLAGMVMGYEDVLKATGLMPQDGVVDPDSIKGADIYLEPAKAVAARIPELVELNLPETHLRKLFKKPISTYLYAAEFESRREAFRQELEALADGTEVFGIDGDGLIEVPDNVKYGLILEQGFTFQTDKYDNEGSVKKTIPIRRRIVEAEGGFVVESDKSVRGNGWTTSKRKFETIDDATRDVFGMDFYGRMNRELVRDIQTRYPQMAEYLGFSNVVSQIVKDRGQGVIKVPSPDGMLLDYSFKETQSYTAAPISMEDGSVVNLGVKTPETKLKGRGLAAFMTHQLDSFVMRETHRRMSEQGPVKGFNSIHDSFGFHPSDAERGQATALQVMQELGKEDYNIFLNILEANQIDLKTFIEAGGVLPQRKGVQPQPAQAIPTALS